ncbi:MAG: CBS domain-containing protein [Anaerolineae bacterium]|nr:CBS domain-containing protein [Anaerolineae bacterium]
MKVRDLLAKKPSGVITISPDKTLRAASEVLAEHNIGALVVVDTAGMPVGILSERDIVRAIATVGENALRHAVSAVMTKDLIIAVPEDDVAYLIRTMTDRHIRHLPIMHDQKLAGIVSIGDVVKAQRDFFEDEARTLERYITGAKA